jgi:hypothetical protein
MGKHGSTGRMVLQNLCKKKKKRKKESIPEKLLEDQFSESYVTVSGEPKILMSETKSFLRVEKWSPR